MSSGREAANEAKGFIKGIHDVTEEARKNVNSFADELADGKTHPSTGFSNDAKTVGREIDQSARSTNTGASTTANTHTTTAQTGKTTGV